MCSKPWNLSDVLPSRSACEAQAALSVEEEYVSMCICTGTHMKCPIQRQNQEIQKLVFHNSFLQHNNFLCGVGALLNPDATNLLTLLWRQRRVVVSRKQTAEMPSSRQAFIVLFVCGCVWFLFCGSVRGFCHGFSHVVFLPHEIWEVKRKGHVIPCPSVACLCNVYCELPSVPRFDSRDLMHNDSFWVLTCQLLFVLFAHVFWSFLWQIWQALCTKLKASCGQRN